MSYGGFLDLETNSILHNAISLAWGLREYCSVTVLDYWVFLDVAKTNVGSLFLFLFLFVCFQSFVLRHLVPIAPVHNTTKLPDLSTASILKKHLMSTEVHSCLL